MGTQIDLTGQRFDRLIVVSRAENSSSGLVQWRCICDCGKEAIASTKKLRCGRKRSCGCLWLPAVVAAKTVHGHASGGAVSTELKVWMGMRSRCNSPTNRAFSRYGARGIRVCKRWDSFENFLADMGRRPSTNHSLDRIDNNGPYSPKNCRWATAGEQCRNKSNNVRIGGDVLTDVAAACGVGVATIRYRIKSGWPKDKWLVPPGAYSVRAQK